MEFGSDTILKVRYFRSLVMFASTVVILTFTACSTESRHRIIIYDHPWPAQPV